MPKNQRLYNLLAWFMVQVNLVEWLKMMIGNKRSEEVVDPNIGMKPSIRDLKRALLVALRCVDLNYEKRPRMGHVVRMLEADEFPFREVGEQISRFFLKYHFTFSLARLQN